MEFMVAIGTFFAVMLTVYGLFARPVQHGVVTDRLGGLRATSRGEGTNAKADPTAGFGGRVLRPFMGYLATNLSRAMPAQYLERLQGMLDQAGSPVKPGQFLVIVAVLGGGLPIFVTLFLASSGQAGASLFLPFVVCAGLGVYLPRLWVLNRIKRRQKNIWRALPDAFDLVTASVEAGLGIDASFARVLERATGPFAEELGRALREIQVGRPRKEAFMDMAERSGVDELRALIHAIVQAETMGISIAGVVRQQTQVLRVRRRQKAQEQAFKAPIKMVFPLVFLIFPAIGVVIGGPAVLQLMTLLGD